MFLLPDLTQMEVQASVHESMAPRLRVGMKADVRIASMADRVFPGRIAEMDLVPTTNWKEWTGSYKHFIVRVRFDKTPPSVLPYMSASVSFDTGRVPDALVIPVGAMSVVDWPAVLLRRRFERVGIAHDHDPPRDVRPPGGHRGPERGRARRLAACRRCWHPGRKPDCETREATPQQSKPHRQLRWNRPRDRKLRLRDFGGLLKVAQKFEADQSVLLVSPFTLR